MPLTDTEFAAILEDESKRIRDGCGSSSGHRQRASASGARVMTRRWGLASVGVSGRASEPPRRVDERLAASPRWRRWRWNTGTALQTYSATWMTSIANGGAREVELRLGAIDERDPPGCTVPKVVSGWRSCRRRCERSLAR